MVECCCSYRSCCRKTRQAFRIPHSAYRIPHSAFRTFLPKRWAANGTHLKPAPVHTGGRVVGVGGGTKPPSSTVLVPPSPQPYPLQRSAHLTDNQRDGLALSVAVAVIRFLHPPAPTGMGEMQAAALLHRRR